MFSIEPQNSNAAVTCPYNFGGYAEFRTIQGTALDAFNRLSEFIRELNREIKRVKD